MSWFSSAIMALRFRPSSLKDMSQWPARILAALAAASVLAGSGSAWASAGCTALNGSEGPSFALTGSNRGTGFSAGDVITLTITNATSTQLWLRDLTTFGILIPTFTTVGSQTYIVPANTSHELFVGYVAGPSTVASWTCVAAPIPTAATATATTATNTDSPKLASLQQSVTPLVANTSAQTITGAVDGAINDAFGNGGTPFSGGPNGFTMNFAAEPPSKVEEGAKDAFSSLAYAGDKKGAMPIKAPPLSPKLDKEWSLWADVRGTGFNGSDSNFSGRQINVTAGLGRKITPDWLVGIVAGYETFNYDITSLTGTLKGHGGTVGAYTGYKILPTLRWDATLTWTRVNYDTSAGTASGAFNANRWVFSTGLTGSYRGSVFTVEPSSKVFALWEKQNEYTDSLGTLQAGRNVSAGRVATGGKIIYPWQLNNGWTLAPYAGLYGDWRFGGNTTSSADAIIGLSNGWSARVTAGLNVANALGGTVTLGGEYGGLGANYKIWTGNARVNWAF